jgi:hypothetical protein
MVWCFNPSTSQYIRRTISGSRIRGERQIWAHTYRILDSSHRVYLCFSYGSHHKQWFVPIQHSLGGVCNLDEACLQRGTKRIFKSNAGNNWMEKDFHLSLSTDIKIIRHSGRIAVCDRRRNVCFHFLFGRSGRLDLRVSHCTVCNAHAYLT